MHEAKLGKGDWLLGRGWDQNDWPEQVFPDRVGEIYQVAHAAGQRWYWASRMQRDEILLIKGWDSLDDGRARFTPHGAFRHPQESDATPARESIEARTYLLFEG